MVCLIDLKFGIRIFGKITKIKTENSSEEIAERLSQLGI